MALETILIEEVIVVFWWQKANITCCQANHLSDDEITRGSAILYLLPSLILLTSPHPSMPSMPSMPSGAHLDFWCSTVLASKYIYQVSAFFLPIFLKFCLPFKPFFSPSLRPLHSTPFQPHPRVPDKKPPPFSSVCGPLLLFM